MQQVNQKGKIMNGQRQLLNVVITISILTVNVVWGQEGYGVEDNTDQPHFRNSVEVGIGVTENGDGKFGEFTQPQQSSGSYGVLNLQLNGWDDNFLRQWYVKGRGETHPELIAGIEQQGSYKLNLTYWQSEKVEMDNTLTPFAGSGGDNLQLPSGYVNPDSAGNPNSSADPTFYGKKDFAVKRDTIGVSAIKHFGPQWALSVDISTQEKEGEKATAAGQGFAGSTLVVEPIDYQHTEIAVGLDYIGDRWQWGLNGYYSELDNDNDQVTFSNPLTDENHLVGLQQLDLYPDNEFWRVGLDASLSINSLTRLSLILDWNEATQNDDFLPYSIGNPNYYFSFSGTPFSPLPASSLDGEVDRLNARVVFSSRPSRRLNYKLEYSYREKDSQHSALPADFVLYSGLVFKATGTTHVYDRDAETFRIEGGYRFNNRTRLQLGWERQAVERHTAEIEERFSDETENDRYWLEYRLPSIGAVSVKLRAERSQLDVDLSQSRESHLHSAEPEATPEAALPVFLAERTVDSYRLNASYPVTAVLLLSGNIEFDREDFDNPFFGLQERDVQRVSAELSWAFNPRLSVTTYAIYEDAQWEQTGQQSQADGTVVGQWQIETADDTESFGLQVNWQSTEEKLELELNLSYLDADSDQSATWLRNEFEPSAMPNAGTGVQRGEVTASWHFTQQTTLYGRYTYERYRRDDWGWDRRELSTIAFAWEEPNYDAHALAVSLRYRF